MSRNPVSFPLWLKLAALFLLVALGCRLSKPLPETAVAPAITAAPTATGRAAAVAPSPSPTPLPSPPAAPSPVAAPPAILLSDGPGGLALVSAPASLSLTVGHVAYLPVQIQDYHRPITVTAQTLIHTYVNDATPDEPGASSPFVVGVLDAPQAEIELQTLRMRSHPLTILLSAEGDALSVPLTLFPAVQPRTPLFGLWIYPQPDQPFVPLWGPDCVFCDPAWEDCVPCPTTEGDAPGTTREKRCGKTHQFLDPCRCRNIQPVFDPQADFLARQQLTDLQRYAVQFTRSFQGGWSSNTYQPGEYLWEILDWLFDDLAPQERDYSPLLTGVIEGHGGWLLCQNYPVANPDGSTGFFDVENAFLLEQYRLYVQELVSRYAPELRFVEIANEPANEFYLCPCNTTADPNDCNASSGPNQPACVSGANSPEFVAAYGDFLYTTAEIAAQEIAAANPEATLVTGALEMVPIWGSGLADTTKYMISQGILEHDNVVIGIHQYPYLTPIWMRNADGNLPDCRYFQPGHDAYWLPDGCETAPPLAGVFDTPNKGAIPAHRLWEEQDRRVDVSGLLHDAESLGVLDRFYLFDTELHAGFHDSDPTTTPARETLAGLRIGAINAHQRVIGSEFIFTPLAPRPYLNPRSYNPYNLLVKHLAGVTPVYAWDSPLMDADYSGLVYKLFTRGNEDIIAIWSNAETPLSLDLALSAGPTQFRQVALTRFYTVLPRADTEWIGITVEKYETPPQAIAVQPLEEFYFLSVISDRPGFGWLAGLSSAPAPTGTPEATHPHPD